MKQYMHIGETRNKLTLLEIAGATDHHQYIGKFRCECGTEKNIVIRNVYVNNTISCGCSRRESHAKRLAETKPAVTHGLTQHPLYQKWQVMKRRCDNPNDSCYLGTTYQESWKKFETFYQWAIKYWFPESVMYRKDNSLPFTESNVEFTKRKTFHNPEKAKKTCLEKYGCDSPLKSKEIREKINKTNHERYGPGGPLGSQEVKLKVKQTNLDRYGHEHAGSSDEIKRKTKENNLKKYNGVHYQSLQHVRQKSMATKMEKYGDPFFSKTNGKESRSVKEFMSQFGKFEPDIKILDGYEIDMFCEQRMLGIEYNGIRFHSEFSGRNKFYHISKFLKCLRSGVNLISVWSDDWKYKTDYVKNRLRWTILEQPQNFSFSVENGVAKTCGLQISMSTRTTGIWLDFDYDFTVKPSENTIQSMIYSLCGDQKCYYLADNGWGIQRHTKNFDVYHILDPDYMLVTKSGSRKRYDKHESIEDSYRIWDCGQTIYSNEND